MTMGYDRRNCPHCGIEFQPTNSRTKHCSPKCRFLAIAADFVGIDGCWEWPKSRQPSGYGQMTVTPPVVETAHRLSYRWLVGRDIPNGVYVCHSCDNRGCFNPAHLFVGSPKDNIVDMWKKGRQQDYANVVRGDSHPSRKNRVNLRRKFTPEQTQAMIRLIQAGLSIREVARRHGVSHSTIRHAISPNYHPYGATNRTAETTRLLANSQPLK